MSILQDLMALRQPVLALDEAEDMSAHEANDKAEELEELHDTMTTAMRRVREIVRGLPRHMRGSAEAYFIPHIMIALGGEHEWMTAGHEVTLQKLIDELKEYAEGSDDGDEERKEEREEGEEHDDYDSDFR